MSDISEVVLEALGWDLCTKLPHGYHSSRRFDNCFSLEDPTKMHIFCGLTKMLTVSIEDHRVLILSKVDLPSSDVIEFDLNDPESYGKIKATVLERCAIHNGDAVPRDMCSVQQIGSNSSISNAEPR